jgi:hypothetical protein
MEPWLQAVVDNMGQAYMIAPVIAAALISGGSGILGALINRSGQKKPGPVKDPFRDPLKKKLGEYLTSKVGQAKPGYEGELIAPPNEALLAALSQIMGSLDQFNAPIAKGVDRFMSPAGQQGWNPVSAGWNRKPMNAGGGAGSTGGLSPEIASFISERMGMGS